MDVGNGKPDAATARADVEDDDGESRQTPTSLAVLLAPLLCDPAGSSSAVCCCCLDEDDGPGLGVLLPDRLAAPDALLLLLR